MISHFLKLEWKQFFRSASHWQKGIAIKIVMGFFSALLYSLFFSNWCGWVFHS